MFNLDKLISTSVTFRPESMFLQDIEANKEKLAEEIKDKKACMIGGAGLPGSVLSRQFFDLSPSVVVVYLNENSLAKPIRDVRGMGGFLDRKSGGKISFGLNDFWTRVVFFLKHVRVF